MTRPDIAMVMASSFPISGLVLEPCRGTGNIYRALVERGHSVEWCEIDEGRDFFQYNRRVDWVITNPPYSIYDSFVSHCLALAENVVLLVPLQKVFKSMSAIREVNEYGGIREIVVVGSGTRAGFPFGFPVGFVHIQKEYRGPTRIRELHRTKEEPDAK